MCDCSNFSNLSALLAPLQRVQLTSPPNLFHGGSLPIGASLSQAPCGLWLTNTATKANQYACWGAQPNKLTGVLEISIQTPVEVIELPMYPLTFLRKHYGPNLPAHHLMNRDICCSLLMLAGPQPVGLWWQGGDEVFLCQPHQYAQIISHVPAVC